MGIQKKILTRQGTVASVATVSNAGVDGTSSIAAGVGTLALGKLGDVFATAYGPVTVPYAPAAETTFGAFVTGKGILVNSDDCAGIGAAGTMFDTKTLKKGQLGTVLVSGGAVVTKATATSLASSMNVVATIGADEVIPFDPTEWTVTDTDATTESEYDGTAEYAEDAAIKVKVGSDWKKATAKKAIVRLVGVVVNGLKATA